MFLFCLLKKLFAMKYEEKVTVSQKRGETQGNGLTLTFCTCLVVHNNKDLDHQHEILSYINYLNL